MLIKVTIVIHYSCYNKQESKLLILQICCKLCIYKNNIIYQFIVQETYKYADTSSGRFKIVVISHDSVKFRFNTWP